MPEKGAGRVSRHITGDASPNQRQARELLRGAIDLHRHGRPEFGAVLDPPLEDVDDFRICKDRGIVASVLKSHIWPTYDRTSYLTGLVPGIDIYPSITLNPVVGGFDPAIVELAASHGVRVIFLPTWGARNDRERGGLSRRLETTLGWSLPVNDGLTVCDSRGQLRADVTAALEVARDHGLTIFTGHISPTESIAIARSGLASERLVFSHPHSQSVGASPDELQTMVKEGALVEFCAIGAHPELAHTSPHQLAATVESIGPENCVITSDVYFPWSGSSAGLLESLIRGLLDEAVTPEAIRTMLHDNPARLLSQRISRDGDPS